MPAVRGDGGRGLAIAPESAVFRRVASGGHADLLTVERAYDPRRRRLRGEIIVDDAREIAGFLAPDRRPKSGWRIVIVDGADEMNRNAANALLKILEEPPRQRAAAAGQPQPGPAACRRSARAAGGLPLEPLDRPRS